jgi:predicted DCC family thiol-disulfide oxidoreductase YuxK
MGSDGVYFIYDGGCPLCTYAAHAFRIRQATGALHLVDARKDSDHTLIQEAKERGLDLDEGMVIVYQGNFYHGREALHFMSLVGSDTGWFNKLNVLLFRSKPVAEFCYPALRGLRNLLIRIKGVSKIDNLDRKSIPLFQPIFGADWGKLPPVMKRHYANHPYRNEVVTVEGQLKIKSSPVGRLLFPLFKIMKTLIPREDDNVRTTVRFITTEDSDMFQFDRTMRFSDGMSYRFHSRMKPVGGNELVEFMRFGLGWRMAYSWNGEKVILAHRGYVLNLFGLLLPLPLGLLMGKGYAEEIPVNDNEFSMMTEIRHPLWGKVYGYSGTFRIA